jgi:hypothetical protein
MDVNAQVKCSPNSSCVVIQVLSDTRMQRRTHTWMDGWMDGWMDMYTESIGKGATVQNDITDRMAQALHACTRK